jgi:hypothetical protein
MNDKQTGRRWASTTGSAAQMTNPERPSAFADLGIPELPGMPSSHDQLFSNQEDWWNNACMNWSSSGWSLYATGYKEAADALVAKVEEHSTNQDTFVYPVLFLYRQYLELQLKMMVRTLRHLLDGGRDFPSGHRIDGLWSEADRLLRRAFPTESKAELAETGRLIREFANVDPLSTAFRYPVDKEGSPSLPGIRYINLRNVRDVMAKVATLLDGAYTMAYEHLQYKLEMEHEYRNEGY